MLEITGVFLVKYEFLHFVSQKLNVLERGIKVDVDRQLLSHRFGPGNVVDPHAVEHNVGDLCRLVAIDTLKDSEKERNVFNH